MFAGWRIFVFFGQSQKDVSQSGIKNAFEGNSKGVASESVYSECMANANSSAPVFVDIRAFSAFDIGPEIG